MNTNTTDSLEFAIRFASVVTRLRDARNRNQGLTLSKDEVLTIIEGMQALRPPN